MARMRVAVLGAGLQGACTALALAERGAQVELIEQDALAMNRASARNAGKIHLGFLYAKDETLRTARLMVRAALAFRALLSRWTGGAFDRLGTSAPFHYLVPYDSAWPPADLAQHYAAVQEIYAETRRVGGDYLGAVPDRLWRRLADDECAALAAASRVQAGFATAETAIPVAQAAAIVRTALAEHPDIALRTGHRVRAVERGPTGFRVEGSAVGATRWTLDCDQVVNALWAGRLAVDAGIGIRPPRPWVHRLKYRVLVELPARLRAMPSCTFALGAYGEVVRFADGPACVSWYPRCLRGWSGDVEPPAEWEPACTGAVPAATQAAVGASALEAFDALVPGLAGARILDVDAGVIFAWGDTDIDDPQSALHQRHDTGVLSRDGYHTVNTGQLTTAPLFAAETADRVLGERDSPPGAAAAAGAARGATMP